MERVTAESSDKEIIAAIEAVVSARPKTRDALSDFFASPGRQWIFPKEIGDPTRALLNRLHDLADEGKEIFRVS